MKNACDRFREGLVVIAHGGHDDSASAHVESCDECRELLGELRLLVSHLPAAAIEAPPSWIAQATALFTPQRRSLIAKLIPSALAARSAVLDEFQLAFEADDVVVRLAYEKSGKRWQVLGKVEGEGWQLKVGERMIGLDDQCRFSFAASKLEETGLVLSRGDRDVIVPSAGEARDYGVR